MMYTSPKFKSEEAARSQAEHLPNLSRLTLGHEKSSNGEWKHMYRGISLNRRCDKHGQDHYNRPTNGSKQSTQQPIKRIASDPQCLMLVTGACASVASGLNTIGRNVACFTCLLEDGFTRATCCPAHGLWRCQASCKTCFRNLLERSHQRPYVLGSIGVGFVAVQLGFLQLLLTRTWVKCTSLDSSRCVNLLWYKI